MDGSINLDSKKEKKNKVLVRWTRQGRASNNIPYALAELRLLRWLVVVISHRPAAIRDPLLEAGGRPADATLRRTEASDRRAVVQVLLLVARQFQRHFPRPRYSDEREAARVEDRLGRGGLRRRGGVEDGVVGMTLLTVYVWDKGRGGKGPNIIHRRFVEKSSQGE